MAAELLSVGAERNLPRLDEGLYFEVFTPATKPRRSPASVKDPGKTP
jgi:hypothetical protein